MLKKVMCGMLKVHYGEVNQVFSIYGRLVLVMPNLWHESQYRPYSAKLGHTRLMHWTTKESHNVQPY